MGLIKGTQEFRTILDFSKGKVSKNMIKTSLRNAEVLELVKKKDTNDFIFIDNDILVGMYRIRLSFYSKDLSRSRTKLREYGQFHIAIYESGKDGSIHNINLKRDRRFKDQYWAKFPGYDFRMKNLVDVIYYLKRLNNLKMFL